MSARHTPGPWAVDSAAEAVVGTGHEGERIVVVYELNTNDADARLIAAAPDYHDAAFWIRRAVAANGAPINPLAALEELALDGEHVTLDAGLVLDLLKAHAKATGEQS